MPLIRHGNERRRGDLSLLWRISPLATQLSGYSRTTSRLDAQAGLTIAALALPSAIAYAELAHVPPVAGLYALLLPTIAYALLGSSRQLVIGPEGSVSALVAVAVLPLAAAETDRYAELASLLALLVSGLFFVTWIFRLGWIADYFSRPVLVGYIHGVAVVLIVAQLGKMFGLSIDARDPVPQLVEFVKEITASSLTTVIVGAVCLALLLSLTARARRLPAALIVVVLAIATAAALDLEEHGVTVVGRLPPGLPDVSLPAWQLGDAVDLLPAAGGVFLVIFADGILTARSFAGKHGQHVRAGRELLAMGAANGAAGFTGSFCVAASGSRTAVGDMSGSRTQVANLVAAAAVVVVLLFLTEPIRYLPRPAVGAVIVAAAIGLVDPRAWRALYRISRVEVLIAVSTAVGVVLVGVLEALVVAVALSLVDVARRSATPHDAVLGWVDRLGRYADVGLHRSAVVAAGVLVYRLDDRLFFANASYVCGRIREALDGATAPVRWLVFDAEALSHLDATAVHALRELIESLHRDGITFVMARLKAPMRQSLQEARLLDLVGAGHVYPTVRAAVAAAGGEGNGDTSC